MNLYDDFQPDVPLLLKQQDAKLSPPDPAARSGDGLGALGALRSRMRLYGLGALGEKGVTRALEIIRNELDVSMALCGLRDVKDASPAILRS